MIERFRWWLATGLMSIAAIFQLAACKAMPTDTDMIERILRESRAGEAPDLEDVFDDDI